MKVIVSMIYVLFTLIGILFLALEGRGEDYCTPTVSTFLAFDTNRGAQLVHKYSSSNNFQIITFEGLYLSSARVCGMNYQRCPNLTVIIENNIVLVVIPLKEHLGLVTYDRSYNNYKFREKYAVDISNLYKECEISSISQYFPSKLTVIGRCLHTKTNPTFLRSVYVVINILSLSESDYLPELVCSIDMPSEFIFLVSATFPMGVTVFIDNGRVLYQRNGENCEQFGEVSVCYDIQRFTSISPDLQAIYCESNTYLLDLVELSAIQTFNYGIPFFCSKLAYFTYKDGSISFHYTTNKTQIGSAVPVGFMLNEDDVVWGACVDSKFVVIQSAGGKVISLTVNTSKVDLVGLSQTIPRIFGMTVLLNNLTHALVYDLQTSKLVDAIQQNFMMGYVVSDSDYCLKFDYLPAKVKGRTQRTILASLLAVFAFFNLTIFVVFGIALSVYYKKIKKNASWFKRESSGLHKSPDNSPALNLSDSNQESANESNQPQYVNVVNSHDLISADSNIICPKSAAVPAHPIAGIFPRTIL